MSAGGVRRVAVALIIALFAAGCAALGFGEKVPPPPCPPILVLKDAGSLTRYKPGAGRDITDIDFQAEIVNFQAVCDYDRERTRVDIALEVAFNVVRGPANSDRKVSYTYFVAIPHFHPDPAGKKTFDVSGAFVGNSTRLRTTDQVHLRIPLPSKKARLEDYTIYVGFQLTREELQENRRRTGPSKR